MKLKLEQGVEKPTYKFNSGFDVEAFKILKVFRGDREIDPENLKKVQKGFNERGYIKLRSLERILFGTGVYVSWEGELGVKIDVKETLVLERGLTLLNNVVTNSEEKEIGVLIYNSTPFLNKIEKGEKIATVSAYVSMNLEPIIEDKVERGDINHDI